MISLRVLKGAPVAILTAALFAACSDGPMDPQAGHRSDMSGPGAASFDGKVGSAFTRLSFTELANVSSGGGMVPTYIISAK